MIGVFLARYLRIRAPLLSAPEVIRTAVEHLGGSEVSAVFAHDLDLSGAIAMLAGADAPNVRVKAAISRGPTRAVLAVRAECREGHHAAPPDRRAERFASRARIRSSTVFGCLIVSS